MKKLERFCSCARAFFKKEKDDVYQCSHCGQRWNFNNDVYLSVTRGVAVDDPTATEYAVYTIENELTQAIINKRLLKPRVK